MKEKVDFTDDWYYRTGYPPEKPFITATMKKMIELVATGVEVNCT